MRTRDVARIGSAVAAGSVVLAASATLLGRSVDRSRSEHSSRLVDTVSVNVVLSSVRGVGPLACSLIGRSLENRWGSRANLGGPDAGVLDSSQSDALGWALTNDSTDDALPLLRRMMGDPDSCVRRTAAHLVSRVRSTRLSQALGPELTSQSAETRETAVLALGYAGRADAESALASAGTDREVRVRRVAAWALGGTNNRAASGPLIPLLRDDDPLVRINAALALGALEAKDAIPALSGALSSDRDPRVRRAAAAALGRME